MPCNEYGWRGHKFVNGFCTCGCTKEKYKKQVLVSQANILKDKILDSDYESPFLIRILPFVIGAIAFIIIGPVLSNLFSVVLFDSGGTSSCESDLDSNNDTACAFISSIPKWPMFLIGFFVMGWMAFKFILRDY